MTALNRLVTAAVFTALTAANGIARAESDLSAIQSCLEHWGTKHPFSKTDPVYRTIQGKVKVMGIGGDVNDAEKTDKPDLVLVKPNVNVLGKAEMSLLNPNGWYCLKAKVAVLGKTVINLHCKANLASSNDGATVLGGADEQNGVTVLGASKLNRVGCR